LYQKGLGLANLMQTEEARVLKKVKVTRKGCN
jgi:hypothetical protein